MRKCAKAILYVETRRELNAEPGCLGLVRGSFFGWRKIAWRGVVPLVLVGPGGGTSYGIEGKKRGKIQTVERESGFVELDPESRK